jgi:hypothetical protein
VWGSAPPFFCRVLLPPLVRCGAMEGGTINGACAERVLAAFSGVATIGQAIFLPFLSGQRPISCVSKARPKMDSPKKRREVRLCKAIHKFGTWLHITLPAKLASSLSHRYPFCSLALPEGC